MSRVFLAFWFVVACFVSVSSVENYIMRADAQVAAMLKLTSLPPTGTPVSPGLHWPLYAFAAGVTLLFGLVIECSLRLDKVNTTLATVREKYRSSEAARIHASVERDTLQTRLATAGETNTRLAARNRELEARNAGAYTPTRTVEAGPVPAEPKKKKATKATTEAPVAITGWRAPIILPPEE